MWKLIVVTPVGTTYVCCTPVYEKTTVPNTVGKAEGTIVGVDGAMDTEGENVGRFEVVGTTVGFVVVGALEILGITVGFSDKEGTAVGIMVGATVGASEGISVGESVTDPTQVELYSNSNHKIRKTLEPVVVLLMLLIVILWTGCCCGANKHEFAIAH